jgi:outer membrane protein OmpA-like peptidoglycan-associated protein
MKLKALLLGTALTAAFAVTADAAASNRGWYVGAEAGANWAQDVDDSITVFGGPLTTVNIDFDTGWAAIATVGYAFWESNWRVELEGAYRQNDIDNAVFNGPGPFPFGATAFTDGEVNEASLMVNALYDIHVTDRLTLSVGAGAGVANVNLQINNVPVPIDDHAWGFAWQGIAGLSYALTDRLDLTLNYRYHRVEDVDFQTLGFIGNNLDNTENHTVTVGLRWDLYPDEEPPAPPMAAAPPPPPPAAPHEFIIFFAFNKANLTPEAHRVVQEAAAAAKQYGTAHILITGHTDTSGSSRYNQRLSVRRANAAKSGLVSEGIDPGAITTVGKGETELLVQTADGVKEPQNRRAAIDLE